MDRPPLDAASPWRDGSLDALRSLRINVAEMSADAERAVLTPHDPGGWPVAWRLETAARICELNGLAARAQAYRAAITGAVDAGSIDAAGRGFADKVAADPAAVSAADLQALGQAGVSDADIVRLCELVAFVAYQCRVEIGHALMEPAR